MIVCEIGSIYNINMSTLPNALGTVGLDVMSRLDAMSHIPMAPGVCNCQRQHRLTLKLTQLYSLVKIKSHTVPDLTLILTFFFV